MKVHVQINYTDVIRVPELQYLKFFLNHIFIIQVELLAAFT